MAPRPPTDGVGLGRHSGNSFRHPVVADDVLVRVRLLEDAVLGVEVPGGLATGEEGVEPGLRLDANEVNTGSNGQ